MLLCVSDNIEEELWKRRGTYMTEYCFLVETFCLQKQVAKEVASKPVDILSEAAMRNAYYTCHNVQVEMQCIRQDGLKLFGWTSFIDG